MMRCGWSGREEAKEQASATPTKFKPSDSQSAARLQEEGDAFTRGYDDAGISRR